MKRRSSDNVLYYVDWISILLYLLLVAIGWVAIYTANYTETASGIWDLSTNYGKQFLWIGIALLLGFVIQLFEGKFYSLFAVIFYIVSMLLLVAVLIFGQEVSGSVSWFQVGSFKVQPSEFAKFSTALVVAKYLGEKKVNISKFKDQLISGLLILIPFILIMMQGDTGSALVFSAFILVLYREGLSSVLLLAGVAMVILFIAALLYGYYAIMAVLAIMGLLFVLLKSGLDRMEILSYIGGITLAFILVTQLQSEWLLGGLGLMLVASGALFFVFKMPAWLSLGVFSASSLYIQGVGYAFNEILKPYQQERIKVILGLVEDNKDIGYNLHQSLIAIGSGGFSGKGFLNGILNKGKFVPELTTDFIFCTIGEEFGFVGSVVLVTLFLLLFIRLVQVAERQTSRFSRVYGYSVASILFFHFFINLSMTVGLAPIIGIPLPFLSYGGSSLIGFTVLLFIMIRLDIDRDETLR